MCPHTCTRVHRCVCKSEDNLQCCSLGRLPPTVSPCRLHQLTSKFRISLSPPPILRCQLWYDKFLLCPAFFCRGLGRPQVLSKTNALLAETLRRPHLCWTLKTQRPDPICPSLGLKKTDWGHQEKLVGDSNIYHSCPTAGSVAPVARVGEVEGTEPGPVKLSRTLLE